MVFHFKPLPAAELAGFVLHLRNGSVPAGADERTHASRGHLLWPDEDPDLTSVRSDRRNPDAQPAFFLKQIDSRCNNHLENSSQPLGLRISIS